MKTDLAVKLLNLPPVRALVVGDVILDVDLHGRFERFAQEAPAVPIFKVERTEERLGGAGAVVAMAAALGAVVSSIDKVVGSIGKVMSFKTRRWVDGVIVGRDDDNICQEIYFNPKVISGLVEQADVVLVADYGKGFCSKDLLAAVIAAANNSNIPVIVDPAMGKDWEDYEGATAIKCNSVELDAWDLMQDQARCWINPNWQIIVTSGDLGMRIQSGLDFPAKPRKAVDVTGCGDMVLACLGVCIGGGMTWDEACCIANSAAGLKVERRGAVPVSRAEVLEDLCDGEKILPVELLGEIVKGHKERGRKVAFTNGCFDVLHAGHVQYLREARAQADVLIVGLNSDASVRALKGIGRPIQSEAARAAVLAGLQSVDFVVLFDSTTPAPLIEAIKPDVLVKGADYSRDQVAGADFVETRGGRVHLVPLSRELSTTRLIEKIRTQDWQDAYI